MWVREGAIKCAIKVEGDCQELKGINGNGGDLDVRKYHNKT